MISTELNSIFQKALTFAKDQRHEYLTIEHVFLALLTNSEGSAIITECQGNVTWMREKLGEYIVQTMQPLPDELEQDPFETVALSRLIDKMIRHVQSAQKKEATIGDLVASIFEEEHSFAYTLLQEQKIDRVDVLEVISHQDSKKAPGDESALETYCINLLDKAQKDQIDPIIGRETEIERTIQVLCRRKKNNPLLLGEPGVGKTAIAEGLALKVSQGDVPEILQNAQLYALDLGTLLAGTKYRGDFEKRLKSVMKELSELPHALLFIDEIHTIVGAGSVSGGSMDASNQLKPALASGALTVIGATTYAEFRNVLDKDKALSRRFARIDIKEPSIEDSIKILKGLRPKYEQHHKVTYSDNSLRSAVELSKRFINDRFLPDVAIDLIDETGASFHLKNSKKKNVTVSDIEHTIARILQIPPSQVSQDDLKLLKDLETKMHKRIIGQDKAVTLVAQAVKRGRAGLTSQTKPVASFLFSGPTGVGKTELSKTLADLLGIHFERLDMSEYMEKHAVSRLVGAPPGYVGFEQGGLLIESVKKHPYMVLLLDEIEKAHPDIVNILLQIMDNASLTDNNGYKADFQNVILIMTSNIGAQDAPVMGFTTEDKLHKDEALKQFFAPEFRNRLDATVNFAPLEQELVEKIVDKFIAEFNVDLKKKKVEIKLTKKARKEVAILGYDQTMGARPLARVIQEKIKNPLSDELLFGKLTKGGLVTVDFTGKEFVLNIA